MKIIYHRSEIEIEDKRGLSYPAETILTGVSAYEFLCSWKKQKEKFKTWLEFSYKDYGHGKFLLTNEGNEVLIAEVLKNRLEKNRRELLNCPQNFPQYIFSDTEEKIAKEKIMERIQKESEVFQKIILDFENEEKKYLESNSVN